jgi:GTPase SAR1 family protein
MREYLYKILVVGDLGAGKTSIIRRYVHNIFSSNYKSTVRILPFLLYNDLLTLTLPLNSNRLALILL